MNAIKINAAKMSFNSNPNIGLYGYCNNEYCLIGHEIADNLVRQIEKLLDVKTYPITLCGTSMIGAFAAGNAKKLIIPDIVFDYEIKKLERYGIDFSIIKTNMTALGNNILCNDSGCLVNSEFSTEEKTQIKKALGVSSLRSGTIAGIDSVGSVSALNRSGCIIHRDATNADIKKVETLLSVKCVPASVNMGSPYLRSGILCNDKGVIIGSLSGGPELVHIEDALGFLKN